VTPSADDAFERLEKLISNAAEPFDMLHVAARRLVLRATKSAPASHLLSIAIDEFHAELQYMTLCIEMYGRDQVNLAAHQKNCRAAARVLRELSPRQQ